MTTTMMISEFYERDALSKFWAQYYVAELEGQDEVNKVVWEHMDDEKFQPILKKIVSSAVKLDTLKIALVTRPVLDLELVRELLNTNLPPLSNAGYGFTLPIAKLLSQHPSFDEKLFTETLQALDATDIDAPFKFTEWLKEERNTIPLGWILEAYRNVEPAILTSIVYTTGSTGRTQLSDLSSLLTDLAQLHYPDLPKAWIVKILESLSQVKKDTV